MTSESNTTKAVPKFKAGYSVEEKKIMPFAMAYNSLGRINQKVAKSVICDMCKLTNGYFSHKKNGIRGLNQYEIEVVKSTFKCFNIDAFTGETIQKS